MKHLAWLVALAACSPALADDAALLKGTWLPDDAMLKDHSYLPRLWWSDFQVDGDKFSVGQVMRNKTRLTGTFTVDAGKSPKTIDFKVNELVFPDFDGLKMPACTIPGIYKVDGDRLTVCFNLASDRPRPTTFEPGDKTLVLTLGRAEGFKEFPKEVKVTVRDPDGKPVPDATLFYVMSRNTIPGREKAGEWGYANEFKTGADGTAAVPYDQIGQGIKARVSGKSLAGTASASPLALRKPELTVKLANEVRVTGEVVCEELKKADVPIGYVNATLDRNGTPFAFNATPEGKLEFLLPPGDYVLHPYGQNVLDTRVTFTVPADRTEFVLPPVKMTASPMATLKGKPAPPLTEVVGWKGDKVTLADLKGKYVLLEFWGYWCGPCVHSMPVLLELHDKFKDKGLAIVGIHLDADGEVDTAAKRDEMLVTIRKTLWKDRDLPFPIALCSGKKSDAGGGELRRGGPPRAYGVGGYPTTVLIDREGKVVGPFNARDAKSAVAEMERLLAK